MVIHILLKLIDGQRQEDSVYCKGSAGGQSFPPIPPFDSTLLCVSTAAQDLSVFIPAALATASAPGPRSQPTITLSLAGGEARGWSTLARLLGAWKGVVDRLLAGDSDRRGTIIPAVENLGLSQPG